MKTKILFLVISYLMITSVFAVSDEQLLQGNHQFGSDVAIYGNWAVIGNKWHPESVAGIEYDHVGMISIYKKSPAGLWEHHQNIVEADYFFLSPGSQAGSEYGYSVDIFSDWIIVGAPYYDSDMQGNIGPDGMAFVYHLNPITDIWEKNCEFKPEVAVLNTAGCSVSISANWAVVGDYTESHPLPAGGNDVYNIGCAHVYHREGSEWVYHTKLMASDGWGSPMTGPGMGPGDNFGGAVDVYDNIIAVGAHYQGIQSGSNNYTGKVYVYEWDGVNWVETWISLPQSELISGFGSSVAVWGGRLVVGAPYADNDGNNQGAIYAYDNFSGIWSSGDEIIASNPQNGSAFGFTVDVFNGEITTGAPLYNGTDENEGLAYIFDINDNYAETNFIGSNTNFGDKFGFRVAFSNADIAVSAWLTDNGDGGESNDGTVYLYQRYESYGGDWTGNENDDWTNGINWADGFVPNAITDVTIDGLKSNMPKIPNGVGICRNLTIVNGASLTIEASGELNVVGNLSCAGELINNGTKEHLTVGGETVFNGAGAQNIPGGVYHDFTFNAGAHSNLQGDMVVDGDYTHTPNKKLNVLANTVTLYGLIWGNKNELEFINTSSLVIMGYRQANFFIPMIQQINNLTIDMLGGGDEAYLNYNMEVFGKLRLLNGDMYIGGPGQSWVTLTLNDAIDIGNGNLKPQINGAESNLFVNNYPLENGDFVLPSGLDDITMLFIEYTGSCTINCDISIGSMLYLSSSEFVTNGFEISYASGAGLYISSSAILGQDILGGNGEVDEIIIFSGHPTLNFSGTVKDGFTVGVSSDGATLTSGNTLVVEGTTSIGSIMFLKSDANGRANFVDKGPISYNTNKADVEFRIEQYIPSKEEWHYISTPVKNSTAEFFAGAYLNAYDTDNSVWIPFTSLDQSVNTMEGYSTKLPANFNGQKIEFSGELNSAHSAAISIDLTDGGDGYNLVGNPFACTIDWDNANWTKTNITDAYYMWNTQAGVYASYINGVGVNGATRYIPAMQGFFVEAVALGASIAIDNNEVKVTNVKAFLKEDKDVQDQLRLQLSNDKWNDEIVIRFLDEATENYDEQFDAHKLFGKKDCPQIFSLDNSGEKLAINTFASVKETEAIPLGVKIENAGEYTLSASEMETFSTHVTIILEDIQTGQFVNLSTNPSYTFNHEGGETTSRFILHFKDVTNTIEMNNTNTFAYMVYDNLYVAVEYPEKFEQIQVYNMSGQLVVNDDVLRQSVIKLDMKGLAKGAYIIKLSSAIEVKSQKLIYD